MAPRTAIGSRHEAVAAGAPRRQGVPWKAHYAANPGDQGSRAARIRARRGTPRMADPGKTRTGSGRHQRLNISSKSRFSEFRDRGVLRAPLRQSDLAEGF
jgi:hypothetical protein